MSLPLGTRIGSYEILSALGAGGMGEVYRARDQNLGRDVAIKVLPSLLLDTAERVARFEREARILASLNHPHIAHVHGFDRADDVRYLVLELVEGVTLEERLRGGRLPVDEALGIARQIADALDAAHSSGIVHRDLKPANIKVRPDGVVKVLDFGLAKDMTTASGADSQNSPTITSGATADGVILGTAAYMSPEQARGKNVDKRTDIWAFGCVLFEMLSGTKPFAGETVSDSIAAVLSREPDWKTLPGTTSTKVKALLRRCLVKDRKRRLRDIGDASIELSDEGLSVELLPRDESRLPRWLIVAAASVLMFALGAATRFLWQTPLSTPATVRFSIPLGPTQNFTQGVTGGEPFVVAFSPDARRYAFVFSDGIHVRSVNQLEDRLIPGTDGNLAPSFSPDGDSLVFSTPGPLKTVRLSGGSPVNIPGTDRADAPYWGEAGMVFGANHGLGGIWFMALGGALEQVTTVGASERVHRRPQLLPDPDKILFTIDGESQRAAVASRKTGKWQVLDALGEAAGARYLRSGYVVFSRSDQLLAAPFDASTVRVLGTPTVVVTAAKFSAFALSDEGSLVYQTPSANTLAWVDRQGRELSVVDVPESFNHPRLSPDGHRLYALSGLDLWVIDLERGGRVKLTNDGRNRDGMWYPDGKRITFLSSSTGQGDIYTMPADGSGPPKLLLGRPNEQQPFSWSPDGRLLAFTELDATTGADLWTVTDTGEARPLLVSKANEMVPAFSPDGRFIAYVSDESGRREVYVRPFPAFDQRWSISAGGGAEPVWRRDGKELFFRNRDTMMAVGIDTSAGFKASAPQSLFRGDYVPANETTGDPHFEAGADGQRFIMVKASRSAQQIVVVLNWAEELKRLARP